MPNYSETQLNDLFAALADPTRRAIIQTLADKPQQSVSELAKPHDMALPSFTQHLKVLEAAGLISTRKVGRVRMVNIEAQPLTHAQKWLERQRKAWEARFDRLEALVTAMEQTEDPEADNE
ncbi:MAG: metalloregulator ArsR/SmtB family transcription factor [Pseudomonadota bacterium]